MGGGSGEGPRSPQPEQRPHTSWTLGFSLVPLDFVSCSPTEGQTGLGAPCLGPLTLRGAAKGTGVSEGARCTPTVHS